PTSPTAVHRLTGVSTLLPCGPSHTDRILRRLSALRHVQSPAGPPSDPDRRRDGRTACHRQRRAPAWGERLRDASRRALAGGLGRKLDGRIAGVLPCGGWD